MVGNLANYNELDVLSAFLHLEDGMSRGVLMQKLKLGEGTIRSILDELKQKQLLVGTQHGHKLTPKGIVHRQKLLLRIAVPQQVKILFYPGLVKIATVVRTMKKHEVGYKERDIAVRNGAEGSLLLQVRSGKLVLPGFSEKYSFGMLEKKFALQEHDIVIVAFAVKRRDAERAVLAVASSFAPMLKKF